MRSKTAKIIVIKPENAIIRIQANFIFLTFPHYFYECKEHFVLYIPIPILMILNFSKESCVTEATIDCLPASSEEMKNTLIHRIL